MSVTYIDTERKFSAPRLAAMLHALAPAAMATKDGAYTLLSRVRVEQPASLAALEALALVRCWAERHRIGACA